MTALKIVKMHDDVILPTKKNPTDSGFDLYAYSFKMCYTEHHELDCHGVQHIALAPNDRILIGTGIKATVGKGFEIQIRPRSGLALKKGLSIINTPGTIDEAYRDEIGIILINLSKQFVSLKLGERIAQLVVCPVILPEIEIVSSLDGDNRGGGFGHTGTN